jgi:hypothetical protein
LQRPAGDGEIGRAGEADDVGVARRIDGDGVAEVVAVAAEVGRVD